jgi:hypothetical protein
MNAFFLVVDWQGWIADRGWQFIWLGLFASGAFALFENGKLREEIKASTGRRKQFARFKLFLLWSLPIIAFIGAAASQWGSEKADREIASLKTNLKESNAALAPRNQPIMSIAANASFRVRLNGTNLVKLTPSDALDTMGVASLMCGRSPPAKDNISVIHLIADKYAPFSAGDDIVVYMDFHTSPMWPMFNVRSNDPAGILDNLDALSIHALFLPFNSEILGGKVTITLNSNVRKDYPIPPQQPFMPVITCLLTNGYVSTFGMGQGGHGSIMPYPTNTQGY